MHAAPTPYTVAETVHVCYLMHCCLACSSEEYRIALLRSQLRWVGCHAVVLHLVSEEAKHSCPCAHVSEPHCEDIVLAIVQVLHRHSEQAVHALTSLVDALRSLESLVASCALPSAKRLQDAWCTELPLRHTLAGGWHLQVSITCDGMDGWGCTSSRHGAEMPGVIELLRSSVAERDILASRCSTSAGRHRTRTQS